MNFDPKLLVTELPNPRLRYRRAATVGAVLALAVMVGVLLALTVLA